MNKRRRAQSTPSPQRAPAVITPALREERLREALAAWPAANNSTANYRGASSTRRNSSKYSSKPPTKNMRLFKLDGAGRAPASRMPLKAYVTAHFKGAGAKYITKGAYGSVFSVTGAPQPLLDLVGRLDHFLPGAAGRVAGVVPAAPLAVKLVAYKGDSNEDWREFVALAMHEATVHSYLASRNACARVKCSSAPVCAAEVVPQLYAAGLDRENGYAVFVMDRIPGKTLETYIKDHGGITATRYARVEKAVATLWLSGIAHADMHDRNVMMDGNGKVAIIDFGVAVVLPDKLREKVTRDMNSLPQYRRSLANAVWFAKDSVQNYANQVMKTRNFTWHHPEGQMLRWLYNKVPVAERARIPAVRAVLWGCAAASG